MPSQIDATDRTADSTSAPRKRRGCFSCLVLFVLLMVAVPLVFIATVYFLFSRQIQDSAWDKLPARTEVALEINDGAGMFAILWQDPKNAELLDLVYDRLGLRGKWERRLLLSLVPLAPKVVTYGEVVDARGGRERVALIRIPWGMAWLAGWAVGEAESRLEGHVLPGRRLDFVHAEVKDNWLVLATSDELRREVCNNLSTPGAASGLRPPATGPYFLAAIKTGVGEPEASFGSSPLMPLAGGYNEQAPASSSLAVLLTRTEDAWQATGCVVPEGEHSGMRIAPVVPEELTAVPVLELEDGFTGVKASVAGRTGFSGFDEPLESVDSFDAWLERRDGLVPWRGHPVLELGRYLARECLVSRHEWAFSASLALPGQHTGNDKGGALARGFRFGWRVDDVRMAEQAFNRLFPPWFEALTSPGGPLPLQNLSGAIEVEAFEKPWRSGTTLRLPPGMLDGASPSCLFVRPSAGDAGSVWLASAREFVPDEGEAARELSGTGPLRSGKASVARVAWRLDENCVKELIPWLEAAAADEVNALRPIARDATARRLIVEAAGSVLAEGRAVWLGIPERRESYFRVVLQDSKGR